MTFLFFSNGEYNGILKFNFTAIIHCDARVHGVHALVVLTLRTCGESHHELAREPLQTKRHPNPCPGPNPALTLDLAHPTLSGI